VGAVEAEGKEEREDLAEEALMTPDAVVPVAQEDMAATEAQAPEVMEAPRLEFSMRGTYRTRTTPSS